MLNEVRKGYLGSADRGVRIHKWNEPRLPLLTAAHRHRAEACTPFPSL